jgi:hypothetical protein
VPCGALGDVGLGISLGAFLAFTGVLHRENIHLEGRFEFELL